ncbi:MAG: MarR family transcriptional regulator [Nitrosopumilaceae archaeon]|nr:MarR family transcriptional regulator [Nitrosopumilaceae archaeon]
MNPQLVLCNSQEPLPEDGILFVRNQSILSTMVRMPIIALGFVILAVGMPIQSSLSALRTIDFIIYQDGSTHVFYQTEADPLSPDFTVKLFGETIENFVAQDENGLLLATNIKDNIATVETFGASLLTIDYDTHDLVSKDGKIWSFTVDTPSEHTVLMPKNTVIVGMNIIPQSIEIIDEQSRLLLPSGHIEISYSFGVSGSAQTTLDAINDARNSIEQIKNNGIQTPLADTKLDEALTAYDNGRFTDATDLANEAKNLAIQEQTSTTQSNSILSNSIIIIIGVVAAAIASAVILKRRKNIVIKETLAVTSKQEKTIYRTLDKETIFVLRPNLRDDDKELISFIVDNGGQAYESELRKKFLQPRTTMWRAVKRLEREGIVEIEKKELQNLVKLKDGITGEDQ